MPRGKKKVETEVNKEAATEVTEKPKKKAGRPSKAQQEVKSTGKRPAARKAAMAAETAEDKQKKTDGGKKSTEKAAPAPKTTARKKAVNTSVSEKPKRKYERKAQKPPKKIAPADVSKEEIIDKIISTEIVAANNPDNSMAKVLLDFNEEEAKVLKEFVKALVAAQKK